jgi:hypothetical protein
MGNYYASQNAESPVFTRRDEAIQFNWLAGTPAPGIPADNFKVEWKGSLQFPRSDRYTFSMEVDDQAELWIAGKKLGDFNYPGGTKKWNQKVEAEKWYDFRLVLREGGGDAKAILYWQSEKTPREIIAPQHFQAFAPQNANQGDSQLTQYKVAGPGNRPRTATLDTTDGGSVLKLQGEISSGLYRLAIPEDQAPYFTDFLRDNSLEIPFTVKRDTAESHLVKLSESDYSFLANFITLSQPQTLEDLIGFLNGNQFGQELWKYLAIGAFLFLLIEIALSRWIAHSRRMGEEITIHFESKDAPNDEFRDQLVKMGRA